MNPPDPGSSTDPGATVEPAPRDPRPGASTFTIEGRSAPGLFVVGWLASLVGLGAIIVAFMAGGTVGATILLVGGLIALSIGLVAGAGSQAIERRARGVRAYAGPSPFLVFAASIPIAGLIGIGVGVLFDVAGQPVDSPLGRLVSVVISALVYIALIRLLVVDAGALSWAAMGVHRFDGRAVRALVSGAIWALPVILATLPVAYLVSLLLPVTPTSPLPPTGDAGGFAVNLLAGAVIAPVGEELMFRGLATTAWVRGMGQARGIIRAAIFFALVHVLTLSGATAGEAFGLALAAFVTRVPVALALGWLFVRRGSIWAPIGLHAAFNAILLALAEMAARSPLPPG